MTHRVSLLGPLLTWDADGQPIEPPTGQLRQLLVALSIRPGQERPVSFLQNTLWGTTDYIASLPPIVSRLRRYWVPVPDQDRGRNTYKTDLDRSEVDATDFIDRVAEADHLTAEEADELLGMWRGNPVVLYDFLPATEFNPLTRARGELIQRLSTWSRAELGKLRNLNSFRQIFEEECETLQTPERSAAKCLLIVDDDPQLTEMLTDLFRGYHCVICHSLGEAMEIVADSSVLLHGALVDLHLTKHLDSQGLEVLDALRERRPDVPRVLLTSSVMADAMHYVSDLYGLYEILIKNGDDAPTRTRRTIDKMLSDSTEDSLLRARATLDTLAARVLQTLQRNAVAVRRSIRLNHAGHDELDAAVEQMEQAETSIEVARSALRNCTAAETAGAIVTGFQADWAGILDHHGTTP